MRGQKVMAMHAERKRSPPDDRFVKMLAGDSARRRRENVCRGAGTAIRFREKSDWKLRSFRFVAVAR